MQQDQHQFRPGDHVLAWRGPKGQQPATVVQRNGHNGGKGSRTDITIRFDNDGALYCAWSRGLVPVTATETA
jgi:hypothetical protein